jgi:hypothetical protein
VGAKVAIGENWLKSWFYYTSVAPFEWRYSSPVPSSIAHSTLPAFSLAQVHTISTLFLGLHVFSKLFADENLLQTLARKREWKFCERPDVLQTVMAWIPTLAHSVQKVYLFLDDFTDRALYRLSVSPGITELALDIENDDSSIHLQHLKIYTPRQVHGSLNHLQHRVSLEITSSVEDGIDRALDEKRLPQNIHQPQNPM